MGVLRIVTLNVNGINNPIKRNNIVQKLKKRGDIISLQETHLSQGEHEKLGKIFGAQIFSSSYTSAKRGTAVLINNNLAFAKDKCIRDKEGRFVFISGEIDDQFVTFINVHNPQGESASLLKKILNLLASEAKGLIVMGGDFNLVMSQKNDTESRMKHKSQQTAKLLRDAKIELGLLDVWRSLHLTDTTFTFYSEAHKVSPRLDYFFMFKHDLCKVVNCETVPFPLADHSSVVLELNLHREPRITVWRFNNSLIMDQIFKEKITDSIKTFFQINDKREIQPVLLGETAKATIRGDIIAYSSWKKKQRENKQASVEDKILKLQII